MKSFSRNDYVRKKSNEYLVCGIRLLMQENQRGWYAFSLRYMVAEKSNLNERFTVFSNFVEPSTR